MYRNTRAAEARISVLLADAQRQLGHGLLAEGIATQRDAAGEARELAARFHDDLRLRQGLASILYNLASMLVSAGDDAAAVPELDQCLTLYESLDGAVAEAGLLCADVRARRGLALARLGRCASAIVDADAAVLTYLGATQGDLDAPLRRDLARVLSVNAAVLASHGDPDLAVAAGEGALMHYAHAAQLSPGGRLRQKTAGTCAPRRRYRRCSAWPPGAWPRACTRRRSL
jgi:tetratricopeptide (TPR) repeat protein